jgi:signal transduction histidine kinase
MDIQNSLSFLAGVINLSLGFVVWARGRKNTLNALYSLVAMSVASWCFSVIPFRSAVDPVESLFWCKILYVSPISIVTSFLFFNFTFLSRERSSRLYHLLPLLPALGILGLTLWPAMVIQQVIQSASGEKQIVFGPAYPIYFIFIIAYFCWSFIILSKQYFNSSGISRMQIRYVFFGTFISANLGMITNLILPTLGIFSLNWLGQILTIIMSSFIAYAIVRYRLLDIKIILKRTLVYSMLLIMTFSVYVFMILSSQNTLGDHSEPTFRMFLSALLVAIGFEPLKRFFQRATDRIFFKGEYDQKLLLSRLSTMMRNTIDLEKLCKDLTYTLMTKLTAKKMAILLVEEESPFVIVGAQEGFEESNLALSSNNPLIEYFNIQGVQKELLVYNELKKQSEEDPSDRDLLVLIREMEKLDITLVGPIYIKGRLTGLFFLGEKRSEDIYTEDEFSMLEIIFSQAGTSIENARLYQRVQEQMEELKKNQSEQLMQSAKLASVGELAVSVAHEINNPLTGILGFTSLLLSEMPPDDPRTKDLKVIESEALRSRQIVRNLLDFSRSHGSKKEPIGINGVIRNTLTLIQYQAKTSNINIVEKFSRDLPPVQADADQLKQVFINLIKNAFDAMPQGGMLTIETSTLPEKALVLNRSPLQESASEEMVMIQFKDSGMGIHPDHMQNIFDPFFTTKGRQMGTGLGLSISYNIIEKHGGRLEVESELGKGSNFIIKLPALSHQGSRNV